VPEGDTIFRTARTLQRALAGQVVTKFESVLPKLSRVDEDTPIAGRVVERVEARGKWLQIYFSGDLVLLTHMLMSGSWHIYRPGERWQRPRSQMRIALYTDLFVGVAFQVPVAEFHTAYSLARHRGVASLGPDVLAADFDEAMAVERLKMHPDLEIGEALLRQSIVAGLGNVFKNEVCFASRVHPFRRVSSLTGAEMEALMKNARAFLVANAMGVSPMRTTTKMLDREERLWVYQRTGEPCRICGAAIRSRKQGMDARGTYWCPVCQGMG